MFVFIRNGRAGFRVRPGAPFMVALLLGAAGSKAFSAEAAAAPGTITFNQHIRPILSEACLHCHGFDPSTRKADLRLDTFEGATAANKDGTVAIQPGRLDASELWRRVNATDPKIKMPPGEHKALSPEQRAALKLWIQQGAQYQKHWAFEPPQRPAVPRPQNDSWSRNDIDRFVLATLAGRNLKPGPEASREALLRRVTLDLTGLPPTPAEVDAFLTDSQPDAYERAVDRLLASPRYGEHMARYWLDAVRYADTHGLHFDNERSMWPYRDWVVRAFNDNLPFDQFAIWQLAGDLLPNPRQDQLVASGFNRCNVTTSEGGAIDEEFRVRYAVDRVETASTVFMGLTMGCAVCHDHKLDPITQKEFYGVFTIFNNMAENAMDGNALLPNPVLRLYTPAQQQQLEDITNRLGGLEKELQAAVGRWDYTDPATLTNNIAPQPLDHAWIDDDWPAGAKPSVNEGNEPHRWDTAVGGKVFSGQRSVRRSGIGLHQVYFENSNEPLTVGAGAQLFAYVFLDPVQPPKAIMLQWHTDKWGVRANWGDPDVIPWGKKGTVEKVQMGDLPKRGEWVRLEIGVSKLGLKPGTRITGMAFTQFDGTAWWDRAGIRTINDPAQDATRSLAAWEKAERKLARRSTVPGELKEILKKETAARTSAENNSLKEYFLAYVCADAGADIISARALVKDLRAQRDKLEKEAPGTMISRELPKPRPAWVLNRGQYDQHGEPVGPAVPAILPPLPQSEVTNRLAFARWLLDPAHPLTARVTVNRFWQQFFGTGIVKTSEDFGSRSEWPSHPELLDWLATEFPRSGWDVKLLVRNIVTSATYRQDASVTRQLLEVDPENRLLARGPRLRLDAEVLRDSALFVSGLLNEKMGGRGVRPYQPPGIWEAVGYTTSNTAKYRQDEGEALWRRSLYTFWKRTAPPPSMTTFDAPSREQCRVRRERTNTPLQALVTMNDPQYVEAARHLGHRMLTQGGASEAERLRFGFRLVTARVPRERELAMLTQALEVQRAHYAARADAAMELVSVGASPVPTDVSAEELAAYTMLANLLLNLDETLTKN